MLDVGMLLPSRWHLCYRQGMLLGHYMVRAQWHFVPRLSLKVHLKDGHFSSVHLFVLHPKSCPVCLYQMKDSACQRPGSVSAMMPSLQDAPSMEEAGRALSRVFLAIWLPQQVSWLDCCSALAGLLSLWGTAISSWNAFDPSCQSLENVNGL